MNLEVIGVEGPVTLLTECLAFGVAPFILADLLAVEPHNHKVVNTAELNLLISRHGS